MSWADDHGYEHISCSCGWSGWSDTGVCERCPQPEAETCDACGQEFGDGRWGTAIKSATVVDETLCEDCACQEGVWHQTTTKVTVHTARKDHGHVKAGDRYKRIVQMGFYVGGGKWLTSRKQVIKRAAQAA